jgi:hypothetical protein
MERFDLGRESAGPCCMLLIKGRVGFIIGRPPVFFQSAMLLVC